MNYRVFLGGCLHFLSGLSDLFYFDKEFIIVCILEAISFFMIGDKELVQEIFRAIAEKELAMTINFSANILQSLIWMLITYFWVRYIQDIGASI